ncbi:wall-associated receptor kinase 2 [Oryza sativa Japonica Group]|uniref:wall-associated receptor kinase 2 n=1 Tax=Oryza sativa subsp. japonica TaxID=39947 RepID=UPI000E1BACD1|nr:wall-associated receptor kinase 2 [Oryza sativa Japonica Group]
MRGLQAAVLFTAVAAAAAPTNCTTRCGDISFEYPFGVEPGCYHPGFNLTCSSNDTRLFMGDGTVQVLDISIPNSTLRVNATAMAFDPADDVQRGVINATTTWRAAAAADDDGGPFVVSRRNTIALMGCNARVDLRGGDRRHSDNLVSSCTAVCPPVGGGDDAAAHDDGDGGDGHTIAIIDAWNGKCSGVGCCQANIMLGYPSYTIQIKQLQEKNLHSFDFQYIAYITDETLNFTEEIAGRIATPAALPATLDFVIRSNSSCSTPANSTAGGECRSEHSFCEDYKGGGNTLLGYSCVCSEGYRGNPYVAGGCHDIDECHSPGYCYGDCKNTEGGYLCQCPLGLTGNASIPNGCKDIDECMHPESYSCYGQCVNTFGSFQCHCHSGTEGDPTIRGGCIKIKHSVSSTNIVLPPSKNTIQAFKSYKEDYNYRVLLSIQTPLVQIFSILAPTTIPLPTTSYLLQDI